MAIVEQQLPFALLGALAERVQRRRAVESFLAQIDEPQSVPRALIFQVIRSAVGIRLAGNLLRGEVQLFVE